MKTTRSGLEPAPSDPARRDFLKSALAAGTIAALGAWPGGSMAGAGPRERLPSIAVVGAGAFGGWTALQLARAGAKVTLVDAWGAGHPRSSSGGESRVIRGMYGPDAIYLDWVLRSYDLWLQAEKAWETPLYTPTGALWMFRDDDAYARQSAPLMRDRGLELERWSPEEAKRRYPAIAFNGDETIYFEPRAGFIAARDACRAVCRAFVSAGGEYRNARAVPGAINNGRLESIELSDGSAISADRFVFACGPWLGKLFAAELGEFLAPTRQEVHYFGVPAGDNRFEPDRFPVWVDFGERVYYGIPGNHGHGFKIADDTRGEPVDPTGMDRAPTEASVERARRFLAQRFPDLGDAPLIQSRVCQYTNSPDGHFVLDRHPGAENLWLAGGGSGHGFKLGPAVGEHMAGLALGREQPEKKFSLERLGRETPRESQLKAGESGAR